MCLRERFLTRCVQFRWYLSKTGKCAGIKQRFKLRAQRPLSAGLKASFSAEVRLSADASCHPWPLALYYAKLDRLSLSSLGRGIMSHIFILNQ